MGLRINTNVASLNAQRNLSQVTERLLGHYGRLSSGLRIATAADDAAGLGISERMRAQIRSYAAAERNAADGISLAQTVDGALGEVSGILTRIRELAVQATNGTLSDSDRGILDNELGELRDEIGRIASSTEFNGNKLLDGTAGPFAIQVGTGAGETIDVAGADVTTATLGLDSLSFATASGASSALGAIDAAVTSVATARGNAGASINRLESAARSISAARTNLSAAESRIRDVDVAEETALLVRDQIVQQLAVQVLAQANVQPELVLRLLR